MNDIRIAIIGLGYVGLPLAVEFGKKYHTVGFDIDETRIRELQEGIDATLEIDKPDLLRVLYAEGIGLQISSDTKEIATCNYFIITVPTPIDKHQRPILTPLYEASKTVGRVLKTGDVVIYESTVYPGATEEDCVPVLEKESGLKFNKDFFCGYSPERINPGDKKHTVTKILKVTSGSTNEVAERVDTLYKSIITAGTFKASSIKVAEAAKVIENSQRDLNIAFVNELSKIFNLLGIDTHEVLEAAGTKWNFLPFKPGLVGGHCIGVDPYYLAQKAQEMGYHPEIILAGRRLNDSMGKYVAGEVVKLMIKKGISVKSSKALILGVTFKENCPDIRNTKAIDVYNELLTYNIDAQVYDPWASKEEVKTSFGIDLIESIDIKYDAVILAVAHNVFRELTMSEIATTNAVIYDVKAFLEPELIDARL